MYAKVGSRKKGEASLHSPKVERVRYPRRLPLSSFLLAFDRGILSRNLQIANITEMAFLVEIPFFPTSIVQISSPIFLLIIRSAFIV